MYFDETTTNRIAWVIETIVFLLVPFWFLITTDMIDESPATALGILIAMLLVCWFMYNTYRELHPFG